MGPLYGEAIYFIGSYFTKAILLQRYICHQLLYCTEALSTQPHISGAVLLLCGTMVFICKSRSSQSINCKLPYGVRSAHAESIPISLFWNIARQVAVANKHSWIWIWMWVQRPNKNLNTYASPRYIMSTHVQSYPIPHAHRRNDSEFRFWLTNGYVVLQLG